MEIINVELLINKVHMRPALWNQKNKSYHNRPYVEKTWDGLAEEMNIPKPTLKKKWKSIRDSFRIEFKKISAEAADLNNITVDEVERYCSWPHMKSLMFLKDQRRKKKHAGGKTSAVSNGAEQVESISGDPVADATNNGRLDPLPLRISSVRHERDEDEAFFDSLLPHIRRLGPGQKMLCRMEMQSIVYKFVYGNQQQEQQVQQEDHKMEFVDYS